jgi:hypothetical protein
VRCTKSILKEYRLRGKPLRINNQTKNYWNREPKTEAKESNKVDFNDNI